MSQKSSGSKRILLTLKELCKHHNCRLTKDHVDILQVGMKSPYNWRDIEDGKQAILRKTKRNLSRSNIELLSELLDKYQSLSRNVTLDKNVLLMLLSLSNKPVTNSTGSFSPSTFSSEEVALITDEKKPQAIVASKMGLSTTTSQKRKGQNQSQNGQQIISTTNTDTNAIQEKVNRAEFRIQEFTLSDKVSFEISEQLLVQDVLFSFRNVPGHYIQFSEPENAFVILPSFNVPTSVRDLVGEICELSWLHRFILERRFEAERDPWLGLVGESFWNFINNRLTAFSMWIVQLEQKLPHNLFAMRPDGTFPQVDAETSMILTSQMLTLHRLNVIVKQSWLREMNLISQLCECAAGLRGGLLASNVHAYAAHGDEFVRGYIMELEREISLPIYNMIKSWVTTGNFSDLKKEFFISVDTSIAAQDPYNLWISKYKVRENMLPAFVSIEDAKEILLAGKMLNFIRYCCKDREFDLNADPQVRFLLNQKESLQSFNLVKYCSKKSATHLSGMLTSSEIDLHKHLQALHKFLLLSQGDFIQALMEALSPQNTERVHGTDLSRPAKEILPSATSATLKGAIEASNARHLPDDVLDRLDVRLLQSSTGDSGWDVFSLDYVVPIQLRAIVSPASYEKYLQIFNFLWRLKRVEHNLGAVWSEHVICQRHLSPALPELRGLMQKCNIFRSELVHFMSNLHNYIMYEVLEASWKELNDQLKNCEDLSMDDIIHAHESYLDGILHKCLLGPDNEILSAKLKELFDITIQFCGIQKNLIISLFAETERRGENEFEGMQSWKLEHTKEEARNRELKLRAEFLEPIRKLNAKYKEKYCEFSMSLKTDTKIGDNFRFLSFRMNFNDYYQSNTDQS